MVHCVVKALNEAKKLPSIIRFIPDQDILKHIGEDELQIGAYTLIDAAVNWVITQVECAIEEKKENFKLRKPGSVMPREPKLICIKMINKANALQKNKIMASRFKFNNALQGKLYDHAGHYIMDVNAKVNEVSYFDGFNRLNGIEGQDSGVKLIR